MTNPIITNVAVVSRFDRLALASVAVIDGTTISADGVLPRGTVICRASLSAKWHVFVHGTDTLAADLSRVLADDVKVVAGADAFASAYFEGFFSLSSLVDANVAGALVAADLTVAAGFHKIEADEVRLK